MKKFVMQRPVWIMSILLILSTLGFVKGCRWIRKDRGPTEPILAQSSGMTLKVVEGFGAKAAQLTSLSISARGVGSSYTASASPSLSLPQSVQLTVTTPPCNWQFSISWTLDTGAGGSAGPTVDVCNTSSITVSINTEVPLVTAGATLKNYDPIQVPIPDDKHVLLAAGEPITLHFEQPLTFAALNVGNAADNAMLQAFDASQRLIDMDDNGSSVVVFGEGIRTLTLSSTGSDAIRLEVIPQS